MAEGGDAQEMISVDRLKNWGRWLRDSYSIGQALSIEGDYRIPRDPYAIAWPSRSKPVIADAWDVEIGCRLLPLPRHLYLKLAYATTASAPDMCRIMREEAGVRLSLDAMVGYEAMSIVLLSEAMQEPAVLRMDRVRERVRAILMPYLTGAESLPIIAT